MLSRINIRNTIIVLILLGIGGYTLYESRNLLLGPIITIEEPESGALSISPVTNIKGRVKNTSHIKMNDRDITIDEEGVFEEKFVLSEGKNVVKVSAEDRFGRQSDVFIEISYSGAPERLVKR